MINPITYGNRICYQKTNTKNNKYKLKNYV